MTPCRAILGWSTSQNALRVYYHQGECVTLNMRDTGDRDEQLEVIERLRAVTNGCGALELSLRRNPMGQLGFHVQPDGVVTQVEISGQAWAAGLRQGYRLVEICKVAVATLSHDQMVDLLKTSAQVTVTVIESFADFTPRRGPVTTVRDASPTWATTATARRRHGWSAASSNTGRWRSTDPLGVGTGTRDACRRVLQKQCKASAG